MIPGRRNISWIGGLWRIWVVLSCLWVVCAYFIADPISRIQRRNDPIHINLGADTIEFPAHIGWDEMKQALVKAVQDDNDAKEKADKDNLNAIKDDPYTGIAVPAWRKAPLALPDPEKEAEGALRYYHAPESVVAILSQVAIVFFIPPLVILAVAYVIGWVGRGFVPRISK